MSFPCYWEVVSNGRRRFESVVQDEAEGYARQLYAKEKVIPEIFVHETKRNGR